MPEARTVRGLLRWQRRGRGALLGASLGAAQAVSSASLGAAQAVSGASLGAALLGTQVLAGCAGSDTQKPSAALSRSLAAESELRCLISGCPAVDGGPPTVGW